jgi:glycosyltransferase involved in cell wall biosynthesis
MQSEPNVRLVILGEGEERKNLTEQAQKLGIANRLELPGSIPFAQIPAYLKAADLFCFASQSETQGLVTLEAMAAGLPIAAYDATGTSDVVVDSENGLLTADEPPALAQAIRRILTDEALRQKLRQGAVRTAEAYEIGRQAGRLTAVYEQAVADQKANRLVQVDPQKPLLKDKWYELLGMEKNPLEVLRLGN